MFFLSITYLVPTPGTPLATMNNPTHSQTQERMIKATRVLGKMRSDLAKEMLGKEQTCMVISEDMKGSIMLLAENGVFIRTRGIKLHMGQILNVVPKYLEGLLREKTNSSYYLRRKRKAVPCFVNLAL